MLLEPGQMLSHYRLVEKIGEGGMGVVWKAEDTILGRIVAIKVLPADAARDEKRRRIEQGGLLVRDNVIEMVRPSSELPQEADRVIDASGMVVLPGLATPTTTSIRP